MRHAYPRMVCSKTYVFALLCLACFFPISGQTQNQSLPFDFGEYACHSTLSTRYTGFGFELYPDFTYAYWHKTGHWKYQNGLVVWLDGPFAQYPPAVPKDRRTLLLTLPNSTGGSFQARLACRNS